MNIDAVITQLRTYCPDLNAVGGAADYDAITSPQQGANPISLPAGFVVPLSDVISDNTAANGVWQQVDEQVCVVLVVSAAQDRRGQAAAASIETLKYAVHRALLGWIPTGSECRAERGLRFTSNTPSERSGARLCWELTYSLPIILSDEDGWTPPSDPLEEVDIVETIHDVEFAAG